MIDKNNPDYEPRFSISKNLLERALGKEKVEKIMKRYMNAKRKSLEASQARKEKADVEDKISDKFFFIAVITSTESKLLPYPNKEITPILQRKLRTLAKKLG